MKCTKLNIIMLTFTLILTLFIISLRLTICFIVHISTSKLFSFYTLVFSTILYTNIRIRLSSSKSTTITTTPTSIISLLIQQNKFKLTSCLPMKSFSSTSPIRKNTYSFLPRTITLTSF